MELNYKNTLLFILLYCLNTVNLNAVKYAEIISGGEVSVSVKGDIDKIISENDLDSEVQIRKTSEKLLNIYPALKYGGFVSRWNYLYINEEVFNSLTQEEKNFFICFNLMQEKFSNAINKKRSHKTRMAILGSIGLAVGGSYTATTFNIHEIAPISILCALGICAYAAFKSLQVNDLAVDNMVFTKFNCAQGALTYFKRLQKLDLKFVRLYMPNILERIENVKKYLGSV